MFDLRPLAFAAAVLAAAPALASDPLPAGPWTDGHNVVYLARQGDQFVINDPQAPGLQLVGSTHGQCAVIAAGLQLQCIAVVAPNHLTVAIPLTGETFYLRPGMPTQPRRDLPRTYEPQTGGSYTPMPSVDTTDTMNAQSCWASAGCESYDAGSDTFTYEEPSFDLSYGDY